jgi:hypothetical protein
LRTTTRPRRSYECPGNTVIPEIGVFSRPSIKVLPANVDAGDWDKGNCYKRIVEWSPYVEKYRAPRATGDSPIVSVYGPKCIEAPSWDNSRQVRARFQEGSDWLW